MKTLRKDTIRLIKHSKARFFSLTAIVSIGMAFFVGVSSSSLFMAHTVDQYMDQTNLKDITIYSNYGFDEDDLAAISSVDGVECVEGAKFVDVYATVDNRSEVTRIHSYREGNQINQFILREGRLPEKENEVLAEGGTDMEPGFAIGSTVKIVRPDNDLEDYLTTNELVVVGWVDTPVYLNMAKENSTLNNQYISTYLYIPEDAFVMDYDLEVNVTTLEGKALQAFSDEYESYSKEVKEDIESLAIIQESARRNRILKEGLEAYEEGLQEYLDGRDTYEREIADAENQLNDAQSEIRDGWIQLQDGINQLKQAEIDLEEARVSGQTQIDQGIRQLQDAEKTLQEGREAYEASLDQANDGIRQIDDALSQLYDAKEQLESIQIDDYTLSELIQILENSDSDLAQALKDITEEMNIDTSVSLGTLLDELDSNLEYIEQHMNEPLDQLLSDLVESSDTADKDQIQIAIDELTDRLNTLGIDLTTVQLSDLSDAMNELKEDYPEAVSEIEEQIDQLFETLNIPIRGEQVVSLTEISNTRELLNDIRQNPLSYITIGQLRSMMDIDELLEQFELSDSDTLDQLLDEINELINTLEQSKRDIEVALADALQQLEDGQRQIEDGYQQLGNAQNQLNAGIVDGQKEILDGWQEIEVNRIKLLDAEREYADGLEEFESQKIDGLQKLEDAAADLAKAKQDLDSLEAGEWTVLDRTMHYASRTYHATIDQMAAIASVFPVFFLLVAALVCLTTMTRMVDEQRGQLGVMRALGYTPVQCASRFLWYAGLAGLIGIVLGTTIGLFTIPGIIYNAWSMMYVQPKMQIYLPVQLVLLAGGAFLAVLLLTTWFSCTKDMKDVPSQLLRPKSPKLGKSTMIERISFVWNKLSFSWKVTLRNLIRYRSRMLMTIIGVAGCTALLITGFGVKDSIQDMVSLQFDELQFFDGYVNLNNDLLPSEINRFTNELEHTEGVEHVLLSSSYSAKVYDLDQTIDETASTQVFSSPEEIYSMYQLRTRSGHTPISVDQSGVYINEKLAENLEVDIGDTILLESDHGVLKEVRIAGIFEMYIQHYILMTDEYYKDVFGSTKKKDTLMFVLDDDYISSLQVLLANDERVSDIVFYQDTLENFTTMVNSLDLIVWVLIIASLALALVVLGNLMNINISERQREIATLKVLGFRQKEVQSYIYKENNILTMMGAIFGIPVGTILHHWIMRQVEMDYVMFGRSIQPRNFVISVVLTVFFGIIVNQLMKKKLKEIAMVESLKSVE